MEAEFAADALLDRDAVARAHHKYYALRRGQECGELDEYDREYVDTLFEVLTLVEPVPREQRDQGVASEAPKQAGGCAEGFRSRQ
jgi:hypothetical protein